MSRTLTRAFAAASVLTLASPWCLASPTIDWTTPQRGVSIAVDAANNVFTVDYEQALGAEITLTKRDVLGQHLWTSSFDQTDHTKWEAATWVATDSLGNAIVTGTSMSGYSNPVKAASIVMKFAPDGTLLWRHVYETSFDGSYTKKCLVDANDAIYVVGMGSGPNGYVTKIKKFAPDGSTMWTWFDDAGIGAPMNFKFAPDGDLLITARSIFGSVNGFARVDATGNTVWSLPGIASFTMGDLASDNAGNTYVLHTANVTNGATQVRKLSPTGAQLFLHAYSIGAQRIEIGPDQQPVFAGFPSPTAAGAAFMKIDAAGQQLWSNLDADGPQMLLLHAKLIVDASNDAYLAAGTLFEMAICKVNADGTSAWTQTMPGSYANDFVLGSHDQSLFVVGGHTARLLDPAEGPWLNLGKSLAGASGAPLLYGVGSLAAGSNFSLNLKNAPAGTSALLVLGASRVDLPLVGGTLIPAPDVLVAGLPTGVGSFSISGVTPNGLLPGTDLYFQCWMPDAGAIFGSSASNGLKATTP